MRSAYTRIGAFGVGIVVTIVVVMVFAYFQRPDEARSADFFKAEPVVDASTDEMNTYAIEYAQANYLLGREPTVRFSTPIDLAEAFEMGFYIGVPAEAGHHFHAVILEGEFVRPATELHEQEVFKFVAYVFDIEVGIPALIIDSVDGAAVKKALNDPTLPDLPEDFFQLAGDIKDKRTHPIEDGLPTEPGAPPIEEPTP